MNQVSILDLERDHRDGLAHKDGVCCWCDHIRQLEKEGYYDFMKEQTTYQGKCQI